MTPDQVKEDFARFSEYLEANGVRVLAGTITVEHKDGISTNAISSSREVLNETMLRVLADGLGFRLTEK